MDVEASLELPGRVALGLGQLSGGLLDLLLEPGHLGLELVLALAQLLDALLPRVAGCVEALHAFGNLLLLARDLFSLPQGVLHVPFGAARLRLLQPLLCFLQPIERGGGLRGARLPVRRRLPHLVGRLPQLPRGVAELGPVLLA